MYHGIKSFILENPSFSQRTNETPLKPSRRLCELITTILCITKFDFAKLTRLSGSFLWFMSVSNF